MWIHREGIRRMWFLLKLYNATRGRHPNEANVLIAGPLTTNIEDDADWKQMANTLSVVAALLTTVTFTAVFTMPGGFNSNGNALLMKKAALQAFVLSDTLAMCTSITVVFFLIWAMIGEPELLRSLTKISLKLLKLALYGTLVAFVTGLYAVTASEALWVIILVFIMVTIVPCIVSRYAIMSLATNVWVSCYSDPMARQRRAKGKRQRRLKRKAN